MPSAKIFRGYCNGYEFTTDSLAEMQAWIDARKADSKGHVLKLHQGVGTVRCATYAPDAPYREAVL